MSSHPQSAQARPHKSTTHQEFYVHIKEPVTINGKEFIGGTVFFRNICATNDIIEFDADDQVFASLSRCSKGDNWNKSIGRNVARKHWFKNPNACWSFPKDGNKQEFARRMYLGAQPWPL